MEKRAQKKEEKKKESEKNALLGFLLKNIQKQEENKFEEEKLDQTDDKVNDINMYLDPRPPNPD